MKRKILKALGYLLSLAFLLGTIFHILATVIYLSPDNLFKKDYYAVSKNYINTIFYQNWHLFSPNPGYTYNSAWIRCHLNGQFSKWLDPMGRLIKEHYDYRVTGAGKLLYVYRDLPREVYHEFLDHQKIYCKDIYSLDVGYSGCMAETRKKTMESKHYKTLEEFVHRSCLNLGADAGSKGRHQIKALQFWPKKFSDAGKSRWSKIEEINFFDEGKPQ